MPQPNEEEDDKVLDEEEDDVEEEGADDGDDSENDDEGNDSDGDDTDDPAELRRQRDAAFARAKKAEGKLKANKNRPPAKPTAPSKRNAPSEQDIEDFVDLRVAGHSREEIREIRAFAQAKGISPAEAAKNTFVQAGIAAMREKRKAKAATPSPSNRPAPAATAKPDGGKETKGDRRAKFQAALDAKRKARGG